MDGYVTVKELRKSLDSLEDDVVVILSKDSEGNTYSPFYETSSNYRYVASTTWFGEVFDPQADEDNRWGHDPNDGVACIVLWPVN